MSVVIAISEWHKIKNLQFKVEASTGNTYGENRTATTQPFQSTEITWKGLLSRPSDHFASSGSLGVNTSRPRLISPYAAADGTPAADTREVNATADGRMVQVIIAATIQTTRTAFCGWPSAETRDTQADAGRTPSRATANTSRDAAVMAMAVFYLVIRIFLQCDVVKEG